jgi:hypothetical protein
MWRVFTARYALSPYIKQIGFVFKGLRRENILLLSEFEPRTIYLAAILTTLPRLHIVLRNS